MAWRVKDVMRGGWPWGILVLLCVVVYGPMFGNGFVWDDQQFIVGNPLLRSLWPPSRFVQSLGAVEEGMIYPMTGQRPLMTFSLALDHRLWKLNPFGYHLTHLLLHILCVFGFTVLVQTVCRSRGVGFLSAALFALHPGHAEGVIAFLGRSDLLATLFVLLGFWGYVKQDATSGRRKALWFSASLASFLLACFSKESGLVLLGILVAYEAFGLGNPPSAIRHPQPKIRLLRLFPFLLVALLYWSHRGRVLGGHAAGTEWWGGSPEKNFLMMFEVYARYLRLLVFPLRLSPLHTVPVPQSFWDANVLFGGILLFGTLGTAIWALRRQPRIGFWISWFLLGLAPVANVIPIPGMILAERWLYLPSVGACALGGWGAWGLFDRAQGWTKKAWAGLVLLAFALFGARTFLWNPAWRNEESVARAIVTASPDSHLGRNNLGNVLLNQGNIGEAEIQLRESLRLKPDYFLAHNNLGSALKAQQRYPEAEAEFREALRVKPGYAEAHNNLGAALWKMGKAREAEKEFREAVRLRPQSSDFHNNLGLALGKSGALPAAVSEFQEAVRLNPEHAEAWYNLGVALGRTGLVQDAEGALRQALRLRPDMPEARFNLGIALEAQGELSQAEAEYREVMRQSPGFADAYYNLAVVLQSQGRYPEAAEALEGYLDHGGQDRFEVEALIRKLRGW